MIQSAKKELFLFIIFLPLARFQLGSMLFCFEIIEQFKFPIFFFFAGRAI